MGRRSFFQSVCLARRLPAAPRERETRRDHVGGGDAGSAVYRRSGGGGTPPLQTYFYVLAVCSPYQPCRGWRPRRPANEIKTPPPAAFSPFSTPRPAHGKFRGTRLGLAAPRRGRRPRRPLPEITAGPTSPHQPCRGRRPRRPGAAVSADPTVFRQPSPGHGMLSRHIMRRTARFPPAVGVGVPDDPFLRPSPAPPRSASPRRGGVPPPTGVG